MATLNINSFSSFKLSQEEESSAFDFTNATLYMLQNLLVSLAEEKLALTFDPNNPLLFAQREAELQGKIGILRYLIDNSSKRIIHLDDSKNASF